METNHVQSESLKISENQEATMGNVLEALSIGQRELAENLFARVSKGILADDIDRHKSDALVQFPNPKRVLSSDTLRPAPRITSVTSRKIVANLTESWLPAHLEVRTRSVGDEVGLSFTGVDRAWLIDALSTKIVDRGDGLYEFTWKQKFAIG